MSAGEAALTTRSTGSLAQLASLPRQARIAGLCYLLVIAGGLFAEGVVHASLVVPGDAAATTRAIAANESLWRWGLAVHLCYLVPAGAMNVIIYGLVRPVQATLARIALVFSMASVAIEAMALVNLYVPLAIMEESGALVALGDGQRQALSYLAIRLFSVGFGFGLVLFAIFCVLTGMLILRSRPVPHLIGAMMIAAGVCYIVNSLAAILSPPLSNLIFPWVLLPILLGELSLALWLAVKGASLERRSAERQIG
jgi:Domain of unknown function (DUF4386)